MFRAQIKPTTGIGASQEMCDLLQKCCSSDRPSFCDALSTAKAELYKLHTELERLGRHETALWLPLPPDFSETAHGQSLKLKKYGS